MEKQTAKNIIAASILNAGLLFLEGSIFLNQRDARAENSRQYSQPEPVARTISYTPQEEFTKVIGALKENSHASKSTPEYLTQSINLPRIGRVSLDKTIVENGYLTWAQATHNGSRIPKNPEIVQRIIETAKTLEEAKDKFNYGEIVVNSWYRPEEINSRIPNAAKNSEHTKGSAVDFYVKGIPASKVYGDLNSYIRKRGGLGKYKTFTHLDSRNRKSRWKG